ncbi:TPA: hypothetical protein I7155_21590 [Vibrio vulnificus]|nr:hypothetical protein [Vibrio vulnificus]
MAKSSKSPFPRGKIVSMDLVIEYPDGQRKSVNYSKEWLSETTAMLMDEAVMSEEQLKQFWGTDEWEMNPTFLRLKRVARLEKGLHGCLDEGEECENCCFCRQHK